MAWRSSGSKSTPSTTRNNPLKPPAWRLFHTPPPSRLRRAVRAQQHPTTNESTATTNAPSWRAQTIIFIITHHLWRAMLSPPRLPALWIGFNASAFPSKTQVSEGPQTSISTFEAHAISCRKLQSISCHCK